MAFPDDYHVNEKYCLKKNWGIHQWSTQGHPLRQRCDDCHILKWIHNDPLSRGVRMVKPSNG